LLSSQISKGTDRTHIEDLKDPHKVLLPTTNLILVVLGEDESKYCTPFTPLDDLLLHLYQGSAIETSVSRSLGVHITGFDSRIQVPNCIEDGLVDFI
jgi:hypothetical protein